MHWSERFLSIQQKDMNCAEFVEHVLREQFGRHYKFPQSRGSLFIQSKQLRECVPQYCEKTDSPIDGDLVLLHGLRMMCHVGIFVKIGRTQYILHTERKFKTAALHELNKIIYFGYSVEGFYKWR